MRSSGKWVVLFLFAAMGCQSRPAGRIDSISSAGTLSRRGNVYLVRGFQDWYSAGIDQLADELRASGVWAQTFREAQWRDLADALTARYEKSTGASDPLVLIGFSYGADDVLKISKKLQEYNIRPRLVITIDPVTPPPVPANVQVCYNYYETNGFWDVFPWLRGIPLTAAKPGNLVNVDLRRQRPDLVEPDTAHSNIAANPNLHREIVARVLEVCMPRETGK